MADDSKVELSVETRSWNSGDDNDESLSGLDFEIKRMTDDADAILESIRSEASTPPSRKIKKKNLKVTTSTSSTAPYLQEDLSRQGHLIHENNTVSVGSDKNTSASLSSSLQTGDIIDFSRDKSGKESQEREKSIGEYTSHDDGDSVTTDHEDDLTLNTDDNSLVEEHKNRISAELMAEALAMAETEFNKVHKGDSPPVSEVSFTTADQGLTVSLVIVWALVLFLVGHAFRGGILDKEGLITFPSLMSSENNEVQM